MFIFDALYAAAALAIIKSAMLRRCCFIRDAAVAGMHITPSLSYFASPADYMLMMLFITLRLFLSPLIFFPPLLPAFSPFLHICRAADATPRAMDMPPCRC